MPLRDTSPLYEWAEVNDPHLNEYRIVQQFVASLGGRPWQYPSVPETEATGGASEIRSAVVPGTDVEVVWKHWHASGTVDLLHVGRKPTTP